MRYLLCLFLALWTPSALVHAQGVPDRAPRTWVLAGEEARFRDYCLTGAGAAAYRRIQADLDRDYSDYRVPADPVTYGDPSPTRRDSKKADLWRDLQDTCGQLTRIAEAAVLCYRVTGEDRYLQQAKGIVLAACAWSLAPDWKKGAVPGATDIHYNDEAHFRLWRKLPQLYDQLRPYFTAEEKSLILAHFRARGQSSYEWIKREGDIEKIRRNSIDSELSSHPVRFMAMTGLAGLALWDDLPEAREWWDFAYRFYRDQFSPWGGDDGGWAEGSAYWRGTFEHAAFQDGLLAIKDPEAYGTLFWQNTPWFAVYHLQPYRHTIFGDASNAGHFNLEPGVADFLEHMSIVKQNGAWSSFAALCTDKRPRILDKGLSDVGRSYPTAAEVLLRNFITAEFPRPVPTDLTKEQPSRYFADVGWVSMHSELGKPAEDIHLTFKSSPYGSFSHSHADQNAFILNAYGESLLINSAYREFHNSPHHHQWTRQTISKNTLLIDGKGQKAQSKEAQGNITRYEVRPRVVLTTGDATPAYAVNQDRGRVRRVTRDIAFIDGRYFVLRDVVELETPGHVSWLLHASTPISWDAKSQTATVTVNQASASVQLLSAGTNWTGQVTSQFPVPVDPKYAKGEIKGGYLTGTWGDQFHFAAESTAAATRTVVYAVIWPEPSANPATPALRLEGDTLVVKRGEKQADRIRFSDTDFSLE